jgi:hypothetical protein
MGFLIGVTNNSRETASFRRFLMIAASTNVVAPTRTNKSRVIRDFKREHPDASNKDIAIALTKRGIRGISNMYVGVVLAQARMRKRPYVHRDETSLTSAIQRVQELGGLETVKLAVYNYEQSARIIKSLGGYDKTQVVLMNLELARAL